MKRFLLMTATLALATGCAGIQPGAAEADYEQTLLNATTYGAYYRPVGAELDGRPDGDELRAERAQAREDRQQARQERREEAQVARTEPSRAPSRPSASLPPQVNSEIPEGQPAQLGGTAPSEAAGYVEAVYALNDTPVTSSGERTSIVNIYRHVDQVGTVYHATTPAIGDLVFFHNVSDRNGDGRNNDWYGHIGIVESVDANETISVLSYLDGEVSRIFMNLTHPDTAELDGTLINTAMRPERSSDPQYTRYLAGELFAGFGSLLGSRTEVVVLDSWSPAEAMTAAR